MAHDTLIERLVVCSEGAVVDVEVRQRAGDVEEDIKRVLRHLPGRREDRPQQLQSAEITLDDDPLRAESPLPLPAHDRRWNVSFRPTVAEVRKEGTPSEKAVDSAGVLPEDDDVVDAPGIGLRDDGSRP